MSKNKEVTVEIKMPKVVFLLFDGHSPDGMGSPEYKGLTLLVEEAKSHYKKCKDNPYCTGKVMALTKDKLEGIHFDSDWEEYES